MDEDGTIKLSRFVGAQYLRTPARLNDYIPVVKAEMLIRKPIKEVFEAFVDPGITTKFWFNKSSGRL